MLYSVKPMHIPDGFLSAVVSIIFWFLSIVVISIALTKLNKNTDERKMPLIGMLGAAIFAAQMINFVVIGGTSGHLMGAAIAAILVGPWAAVLVMTTVVAVQAVIFQDGGLLVLGANIFNMGILGVAASYIVYKIITRLFKSKKWGIYLAGFSAAWFSIVLASVSVSLQLALSGTSPIRIVLPAMVGIHSLIGIGEGLITIGALTLVFAARPDILQPTRERFTPGAILAIIGFGLALGLVLLSPMASTYPDGLEWVAEQQGFLNAAREPVYQIIPDYILPGISNEALATILAGILGITFVFIIGLILAYARRKRQAF
jgi:cobalt/nickel transport system permease protein